MTLPPPPPPTPADVVRRHILRFENGLGPDLADAYATDAVIEQPFMPSGPVRLEGRDAIRAYFAGAARLPVILRPRDVEIRATVDPDVVVAEYKYEMELRSTGARFEVANIQVMCVRDGEIAWSRDYHQHEVIAAHVRAPASEPDR